MGAKKGRWLFPNFSFLSHNCLANSRWTTSSVGKSQKRSFQVFRVTNWQSCCSCAKRDKRGRRGVYQFHQKWIQEKNYQQICIHPITLLKPIPWMACSQPCSKSKFPRWQSPTSHWTLAMSSEEGKCQNFGRCLGGSLISVGGSFIIYPTLGTSPAPVSDAATLQKWAPCLGIEEYSSFFLLFFFTIFGTKSKDNTNQNMHSAVRCRLPECGGYVLQRKDEGFTFFVIINDLNYNHLRHHHQNHHDDS